MPRKETTKEMAPGAVVEACILKEINAAIAHSEKRTQSQWVINENRKLYEIFSCEL